MTEVLVLDEAIEAALLTHGDEGLEAIDDEGTEAARAEEEGVAGLAGNPYSMQ